jgi:hypothetical protein
MEAVSKRGFETASVKRLSRNFSFWESCPDFNRKSGL